MIHTDESRWMAPLDDLIGLIPSAKGGVRAQRARLISRCSVSMTPARAQWQWRADYSVDGGRMRETLRAHMKISSL